MKKCPEQLLVGGLQPLTMIDFPGRLSSVVFTQGCNLRCRFCYNRGLLPDTAHDMLSWKSITDFLKDRQGFIEAVVFSGGEPCGQSVLLDAMREVRELGFEIALHTNGFFPAVVEQALSERLLQFVAVDFKAPFERYEAVTRQSIVAADFGRLADLLVAAGVKHEYRTTVHPGLLSDSDIMNMADWLCEKKIGSYAIQKFKHGEALDATLQPVTAACLQPATLFKLRSRFTDFTLRADASDDAILQKVA
ncbi:MAG: anaerobic ribonucleoside-triphosphate reductase activating protein [Candidatus Riflebacteria bacterium HGW-Riflebacteria-1]|jgi:pyruvate formate lyase activating enzyme|nr:MAG: anaerobic ribonucleoside-triphosphate reductase activating protein [Candidatus Riflebacteria bacterium HGW-Riflebacteria-1]